LLQKEVLFSVVALRYWHITS